MTSQLSDWQSQIADLVDTSKPLVPAAPAAPASSDWASQVADLAVQPGLASQAIDQTQEVLKGIRGVCVRLRLHDVLRRCIVRSA